MTEMAIPVVAPNDAMRTPRAFRALQYRNARIFFAGMLVSTVGTWLQLTAMSLLVYRITGRSTDVGVTVAFQFLPMLLLGAWAGAVADRRDKRTLALLTQSGLALQAIVLGVIDLAGHANLPVVYGMSLVLGVVNAFDNPARRGLVVELVDPSLIANATSLNTAVMTGARIFGPALAALLVNTIGTGWCFLINGLSFGAVLASLLRIRTDEMFPSKLRDRAPGAVREAVRFIMSRRELIVVFVVLILVSTFAFNYAVSLPKLADERWGGEDGFGWVLAVMSIGSLSGSLLTARFDRVTMRWFLMMTLLLGASGLLLSWAPDLWVAFIWAIPVGLGGAGFITVCQRPHPTGEPVRHARAPARLHRSCLPRVDPDRWSDHGHHR